MWFLQWWPLNIKTQQWLQENSLVWYTFHLGLAWKCQKFVPYNNRSVFQWIEGKDKSDISKPWDSPCNRSSCGLHKNSWEKGQFWLLCYIYSKICQIIWSLCLNTLFHILNLATTWLHEKRLYLACSYLISNTLQDLYRNKSKIFQPANKRLRIQFSDIFSSLYNDAMIFSKSTAVIY